ncbi:hypothetical protein [Saccharothrix sp.]|uniref:VMAP-C domain-containing protein n=1 Tax=Saccharothrix sp. TaxID=1873460 RepID=UPI002811788E|nr:hypothetical protein [Saccharothrix sp.]
MSVQALHHAVLVVDVERFSDSARGDLHRKQVQEGLVRALRQAFAEAGIDLDACRYHDRGDGALILVPAHIPETQLVDRLPHRLSAQLRRHNALAAHEARIRLRLALHCGPVEARPNGGPNAAIIVATRLVDSDQARAAQQASTDPVTVIVSERFFEDAVRNEPAAEPDLYRAVAVAAKEYRGIAYVRVDRPPAIRFEHMTFHQARDVANTLMGKPSVRDEEGRRRLLAMLPARLAEQLSPDMDVQSFAWECAHVCLAEPHGVEDLDVALRRLDAAPRPVVTEIHREIPPTPSRFLEALSRLPCLLDGATAVMVVERLEVLLGEKIILRGLPGTARNIRDLAELCEPSHHRVIALLDVVAAFETEPEPLAHLRRVVGDMQPVRLAEDIFTPRQKTELLDLLAGVVLPEIGALYRSSGGPTAPELREQTSYSEILNALESLNARADGLPRTLVFVEQIALRVDSELKIKLRQWTRARALEMGVADELLDVREEVKLAHSPATPSAGTRPVGYLVIRVERVGPAGGVLRLVDWRQFGEPSPWEPDRGQVWTGTLEGAKHHVAHLLDEVETRWAALHPDPEIHVEFVLDLAELVSLDVEDWPWEDHPYAESLGRRYHVARRSADRMRRSRYTRDWKRRWDSLVTQLARTGRVATQCGVHGSGNDEAGLRKLAGTLSRQRDAVSLVLSRAPEPGLLGQDELAVGLRSGLPLVLWNRHDAEGRFTRDLDALVHGTDDARHLVERLRDARIAAFTAEREDAHVGYGLACVYDDPNRTVIPHQPGPPVEQGVVR